MYHLRDHVKTFADYTNTKQPNSNIRFTFEKEDQNSFSFLDVKLLKHQFKACKSHMKCSVKIILNGPKYKLGLVIYVPIDYYRSPMSVLTKQ